MSRGNPDVRFGEQIRSLFAAGSLGGLPDGQLLDLFRAGDAGRSEQAFEVLVERHGPMVLGVCRRLLGDPHLAEDAFQAAFLILARRARSERDRDALGGWLHRVARRVATRSKIRVDRRKARERPGAEEVAAVKQVDRIERDEIRSVIDEEIDRLGDPQRLPVVLCCLEGLSHEEASLRLRWPLGTVKSRLARGRLRLQERLVRRGFAPATAALAATVAGTAGAGASAAVSPSLVAATARIAAATFAAGGATSGVVPAAVSALIREELGPMMIARIKLAAGALAAGASVALVGLALGAPRPRAEGPVVATPAATVDAPDAKPAAAPGIKLSAAGRVVDAAGRPVPGATVILREWAYRRATARNAADMERLARTETFPDILAAIKADEEGRFRFEGVAAPAFPDDPDAANTSSPWDVVAVASGHGAAWVQLTPHLRRTPITLTLAAEGTLRGRVLEPGGAPVVGAGVKVVGIDPLGRPIGNGLGTGDRLNLGWSSIPLGSKTDAEGRFTVLGLPRDRVASLNISEPRHERVYALAATTDAPQPDDVSTTYQSGKAIEGRRPVHTGEFTLTAATIDHVLTGRVVFEADGKPAAKASVWISKKMAPVTADEGGRFAIEGLPAGQVEVHATLFGSDAAPLDARLTLPEAPRIFDHDLVLPRGLILKGRVVDEKTGAGVGKVGLNYLPSYQGDEVPTMSSLMATTGPDGRYRLVVPPGRGTLELRGIPPEFPQPGPRSIGQPAGPKFSKALEGRNGQEVEVEDFRLAKGGAVVLRVVDPEGRPVANARVDIRDMSRGFNQEPGRTDAQGRFEVAGLPGDRMTIVDIAAEGRPIGETIEIPDPGAPAANGEGREVRLRPLVALSGRVLDEDGKPLAGPVVTLQRNVSYPDQNERSFGTGAAILGDVKDDGTYTHDRLIPGATYNVHVEVGGHVTADGPWIKVKPGPPIRLDDFRLPAADREVNGVVVDARGKPVAGINVGYQWSERTQSFYAPQGAVWFHDTDTSGRFHLTGLPRGPVRLQAYRHPEGPDRQIKGMRYAEVPADGGQVRIELPDPNDRLRGIE